MADGIERKITLGIGIDVNTEKVKTADAMLSSFVKKYDDTILKVDTNDFNKAAREIKSLEDEINRVKKQSPKMLPALDPNIKQVENFRAKYKDAFAIFTDGSIAKGIDNIFDKIENGGAVSIIDLGSRMEYLKRQATEVIKEIKSVGDLTKFWDGTLDYRSGNMDSSGIQKRIDLINKLIECQKELQMFSPTKLESKDFESGHSIRFLESMANELNQSLTKLKNFNLQTTEQLNRREELISKIYDTSNWQDNKGSGFEEYLKSDKGDFEWYIANLKDCVTERKQLLKDFNNSEDELFSTDGNEWRNILRDQIDEQEQYIKRAQEVREASSKTNNVPINTDFTEAIQALNEIRDAIREVKEAFEPLTTALSTEGTAFQQMATQGSASLDTLAAKLKEVRELVDQLNQKDFKVTQNVFQGKSGGANEVLSTYKAEAKSLLKIINNISNTVLGTFGNTGLKTLFPENIVKELISFASISDQLGKDINGAKGVAEIKSIYASLEEYAKIIYKIGEITNQKFPGFIDLSKLQNAKSVLDIEGMISAGTSNAKNESTSNITDKMLGEIKTARDQIDAELQAIRQRIESTFDLSTIEPNYQNVQFITDTIYQYFKDLETKIKALDFNISIPEIKSNVDSSTLFLGNEASEFNNITSGANSAADAKNKFTAANKQAGPSAEESVNSFKKEEQYLENVGQAADVTCDKIKSVSDANGNLLHTTQTSSNVGKKSINTIIDSYSYDEDGNPQLQTTTFIQDFKKRIDEVKKETTKIKTAQTNLKKFLSQFNSKTAGMGQYLTGYQALSGFNINSIDDIDKAIQMMMNLDSEYNKLSQNFRKGTKSMNPFANAINSIDEMENKIKQARAAFSSLNTQPDELKTKISNLSPLFDKLQSAIIKDADGNITSVDIYKLADAYGKLNVAIKQVNSGISTQRKLDIADRVKNKENDAQLQKELNTLYQKRQGILNNIAKYTDKSQNLKTERGRSSAQEALDIEKERLAAINEEIYAYGDLVNQKKIDLQDTKLAEKIRTKNLDSYIKTEDITETEKANDLLNQRSEVIGNIIRLEKQLGKTTSSQDNEAVQKVLDNEKEKYKVLTDQLSVYKEQSIQQQVNAQDEKLISGVKNNNMQQFINDAAKAGKSQFKEISDLYSIYLNAQKNIRKMDLDFSGKDYTDRRANAENVALQAREKLLALGVDINDIDASDVLTIEQKTKLLEKEASQREELNKLMSEASDKERNAANAQAMKPIDAIFKQLTNAFGGDIDKYISNVFGNMTLGDNFKNQVAEYKTALKDVASAYDNLSKSPFDEKLKAQFDEAVQRAKDLGTEIENVAKSTQNFEKYGTAFDRFKKIDNIDDVEKLKSSMLELANSVTNNKFKFEDFDSTNKVLTGTFTNQKGEIEKLTVAYNDAAEAAQAFHKNTNQKAPTLFGQLKGLVTDGAKRIISLYLDVTDLIRYASKGVQAVREIDLAMTELKKVTDETDESYTKFLKNASKTASTIGATLKDFTTVTSDFARLGYSMEESADLAKVALVYENVGDGFSSVSEASESIISTMKAFGIEATDTMEIVDKFNEVGNNFAITSKGIGDALQRSASSLYEAGNTLDESIGLITGMNSVVQDPEMVGTALKTLTMRLRGAKTELEDAGLDTENMASSTSKLREQLLALTGVDIMQDANTFKSTTQILREMSAVWEDLSDIDAAAALELMGGKRQANILASALKNWQTVEDAISTSLGSEGSALEENQKYLDSIQGRIDIFNNAIQTMWSNLISSDFIKGVVDVGTTLVEIFDSATGKVLAFVAALHLISKFKFGRKDGILDVVKSIGGLFSNFKTGFAAKGGGLSGIFGGLASVGFGNVFTIALALLPAIIALVNKLKNRSAELKQEVQQINSAYQEQKDTIEDNLKQLTTSSDTKKYGSLQAEFNHLAKGVDEQGNNVSLTADEYERYRDICETIVGIQPSLAAGYDNATAAIGNNASALANLIKIQKDEARQKAYDYVDDENLEKIADSAIDDYKATASDVEDALSNIWFGDGGISKEFEVENSTNPFRENAEKLLESLGYTKEQIEDSLYEYSKGGFRWDLWTEDNIDLLLSNIEKLPNNIRTYVNEYVQAQSQLDSAKNKMVNTLLEVPKSLEEYDKFSTSEKSFITDWIKNSGVFEIDENTTSDTVLAWKSKIRDMIYALDADSFTTEIEGKQISASDILDSIYNLDPSTLNWEKYKSEMSGLIDHFWNAIGADDNQFGLKKDSLSKMFGFDEENLQEQYDFMFTRLSSILGKDSAEFQKWKAYIEGLDAVKVKRLIEVDWNVVDKNNLESTINGALVDDFTVKNFSHYSDSIDSIKSNISTLQDALESLESGSFTYSDFIELAQQFPELAEGVDTSSDAFDGLAINLQKAIKAAPDDLVNELKDLRKQLVETGKDTTAIDQLIDSIENLPTDAVDSLASKFGTLSDKISEANTAQGKLSAAMSEDPDANYKNTSEALQKMKELYDSGVVGSESQVWSIYESLTGKSYDYTKSLEDNKKALKDWIDTYDSWYLSTDNEEYSTAGLENFLNDVEAIVTKAKANGEEWAKDITWTYENGVAEIDFANTDWDTIADHVGVTSEMFADLMMHAGQFLEINWTQSSDIVDFFRKLEEEGKSASERLAEAEPYVKGFLENKGISSDWLDGNEASIIDGKIFLNFSEDEQTILKEYWHLKDIVAQDPLEITAQLNTDKIEDGLSKESIASLQELVDVVTDAGTGTTWLSFDELKNAAKEAGYTEEGINKLIAALDKYGDKVLDLNVTKEDPLGLVGMIENVDATVNYLKALEIEAQNVNGSLQIDLTSFVTNLKQAGLAVGDIQSYVSALPENVSFTFEGNVITNADETNSKISELYANVDAAPQEEIRVDLTGNAEDCLKSITNYLSGLSDRTITVTVNYKSTGKRPATSGNIDGDDGTGGVNRTAYVQGTAYKSGKWGLQKAEHNSLVGELGQELVVDPNSGEYYTVGDNGAEMVDLPKNAIVFNHKQTKDLLSHGYAVGRGKAYANGTSYSGNNLLDRIERITKSNKLDQLAKYAEEMCEQYEKLVNGNVDLRKRPHLSPSYEHELAMGGGYNSFIGSDGKIYASTAAETWTIGAGENQYTIDITPVLENGEALTSDSLAEYVNNLVTDGSMQDLLNSDKYNLIIRAVPGEYNEEDWAGFEDELSKYKDGYLDTILDMFNIGGEKALEAYGFSPVGLADVSRDLQDNGSYTGKEVASAIDDTSEGMRNLNELINQYVTDVLNAKSLADEIGTDLSKTEYGNVNTDTRQKLYWDEESIDKYSNALDSWGMNADDIIGSYSTLLSMYGDFDGVDIAFTPMLQTEDGPQLLDSKTVNEYIWGLIDKASKDDGQWTNEELFQLDTKGLEFNGTVIKNLLEDIGESSSATSKLLHYVGDTGSISSLEGEINTTASGLVTAGEDISNVQAKLDLLNATNISDKTFTVTAVYQTVGSGRSEGVRTPGSGGRYTKYANGTAHINGNAYSNGYFGAPHTEKALTGELGPEMIVRGNKWFTVGDNGAEFTDIKKGDIIFNHKQTESLLKNGYVTGRGKAYASGTAYAIPAAVTLEQLAKENKNKIVGAIYAGDSKINGKLDSSENKSKSNSSSGNNNDKKDEGEKETFDFIEIKMEEIETLIEKITAKIALFLDDTSDINKKDNYYDQLVEAEKNKASTYLSAAEIYNNKAAELLKEVPEKYRDMAQNGAIAIEDFVGEDEQKTIDAINNYREWSQKADEAEVGYLESVAQAAAYRVEQLDDIATDFENLTNQIETQAGLVQSHIDLIEESGNIVSEKFYKDLMKKTKEQRSELVREKQSLQKILDDAVKSGDVTVGTDEWFEMVQAIYDVDDAIIQCDIDLEGYQNSINELSWESFERLVDQLDNIDSELSFISDLMSKNDWEVVDEDANWTDKGITALGMYAQQMEIAQTKSQQYAKEIKEFKKLRDKGLVSETEYIEKLAELKDGQMDAINAYEDAKDAIVNLNKVRIEAVKEGLQDELDAYQELIEKKKETLDADKDLYDFEKSVEEQQKNIATIQRKIAALSGDNSLSATAQRRKLEAELLEAQADLEDTYRDRSYDNTIDALDKESEAYEESINTQIEELDKSLENIDAIVTESLATVRANTDTVLAELVDLSKTYGIELSKEITSPWADGEAAISAYSESFKNLKDSFAEELNYLIEQEKILQKEADKAAQSVINSLSKNESTVEGATNPDSSKKYYQSPTQYGGAISADGIVGPNTKKKFKTAGYAKGTLGTKKDELALIDELGEELVMHAGPDGKLMFLSKGSSVIPSNITENLMKIGQLDPTEVLKRSTPSIGAPHITNNNIEVNMQIAEVVHIDEVTNETIPDLTKAVEKQMDKYMKNLNGQIRKYAR